MKKNIISRIFTLAGLFIKEQFKEPIALFWIVISPCALFYFFAITRQDENYFQGDYMAASAWFYAYVASSVALFGFSYYIIGRRESGFIRSFAYSKKSKLIFLCSHFFAYSTISIVYCSTFYLTTKFPFGGYSIDELLTIVLRFYICFVMFCSLGVIFTLLPINFQNSNTLLSIFSFCMLIFGVLGASNASGTMGIINSANPLTIANQLMAKDLSINRITIAAIMLLSALSALGLFKYLLINPVWSRY